MDNERDIWIQKIDAALKEWCQGDYVLGKHWFVQRCNPNQPLTVPTESVDEETGLAEYEVRGFVVVTQTCDIVRSCDSRPFIIVMVVRHGCI